MNAFFGLAARMRRLVSFSSTTRLKDRVAPSVEVMERRVLMTSDPFPAWLASGSDAEWHQASNTLTVPGAATVNADPGVAAAVKVVAGAASAHLTFAAPPGVPVHLYSMTLSNGAKATIAPSAGGTVTLNHRNVVISEPGGLTINGTSKFDITDNGLVIDYPDVAGPSPAPAIEAYVASGYNGGDWLGSGVTSSTAANDSNVALGTIENNGIVLQYGSEFGQPLFAGEDVDATAVIVKFTHRADLDLDASVTPNDASIFGSSYDAGQPAIWAVGDMDYDGLFTPNDASIFGSFYDETLAPPAAPQNVTATARPGFFYIVDLDWDTVAGTGITYNVYAGTTPGFVPSSETLLAAGLTSSNFTADTLDGDTTYYFAVTTTSGGGSDDPTGGTTSSASAGNDGDGVTTPPSTAVAGWTALYDMDGPENEDVTVTWSQEPDVNNRYTGPVTITITNVPPHAIVGASFLADLQGNPETDRTLTISGAGGSGTNEVEYWDGLDGAGMTVADIKESTSTLTITMDVELDIGESWLIHDALISVYTPTVTIAATDAEEGNQLEFVVSRTGPTVGDLPVFIRPPKGTATEGVDFDAMPRMVTIPDGQATFGFALDAIADDKWEQHEEAAASISPRLYYATLLYEFFQLWQADPLVLLQGPADGWDGTTLTVQKPAANAQPVETTVNVLVSSKLVPQRGVIAILTMTGNVQSPDVKMPGQTDGSGKAPVDIRVRDIDEVGETTVKIILKKKADDPVEKWKVVTFKINVID
jgi:hypothetical protein